MKKVRLYRMAEKEERNIQNMKTKKIQYLATAALLLAVFFTGCGSTPPAEETAGPVGAEQAVEESATEPAEPAPEPEPDPEPEPEEIVPAFEEDANVYGNSRGNLYNEGIFVECGDGGYIENNGYGRVVLLEADGKATVLDQLNTWHMNYKDGQLFGIQGNLDGETLGILNAVIDEGAENVTIRLDETVKPETLFLVNDDVYYTDAGTHRLYRYEPEGEDELLIDTEVYNPVFYKDRIIYQRDADGESLHSISPAGEEDVKLNDVRSYWPIVYRDKIYYQAVVDAAYTLRRMELDGSEDTEIAKIRYSNPVVCQDRLFLLDIDHQDILSCLDLTQEEKGVQTIDIGGEAAELFAGRESDYGRAEGTFQNYEIMYYSNLSNINDKLMFETFYGDPQNEGDFVYLSMMYDPATARLAWSPYASCDGKWETSKTTNATAGSGKNGEEQTQAVAVDGKIVSAAADENTTAPAGGDTSAPNGIVPIKNLANYSSLKKKMTDAEFQTAYDEALKIVQPLVGLSQEEQAKGIYSALRAMADNGTVSYSEEAPHYNDAYGYLINHTASCAGSARTTGLCLNMLGMGYEHVNENQWDHQWCRVNINGTMWIVDPYGMVCAPESAPYAHPLVQ